MATMQNQQYLDAREIQKIDVSRVFFAFSALAFGVSLVIVVVGIIMPASSILTSSQTSFSPGSASVPSSYYTNPATPWLLSVSAYVFLVFPAIGAFCALLGVLYYKRDLVWRLAQDIGTYFNVMKYLDVHGIASSDDHGQVFTDDANGVALEIKEIITKDDVEAVEDHIAKDLSSDRQEWPSKLFVVHDKGKIINKPKEFCSTYNINDENLQSHCIVIDH